jgi:hypothetical protein
LVEGEQHGQIPVHHADVEASSQHLVPVHSQPGLGLKARNPSLDRTEALEQRQGGRFRGNRLRMPVLRTNNCLLHNTLLHLLIMSFVKRYTKRQVDVHLLFVANEGVMVCFLVLFWAVSQSEGCSVARMRPC